MTTTHRLTAIDQRRTKALNLVPAKGERPPELFDALVDTAADVAPLLRTVRHVRTVLSNNAPPTTCDPNTGYVCNECQLISTLTNSIDTALNDVHQ